MRKSSFLASSFTRDLMASRFYQFESSVFFLTLLLVENMGSLPLFLCYRFTNKFVGLPISLTFLSPFLSESNCPLLSRWKGIFDWFGMFKNKNCLAWGMAWSFHFLTKSYFLGNSVLVKYCKSRRDWKLQPIITSQTFWLCPTITPLVYLIALPCLYILFQQELHHIKEVKISFHQDFEHLLVWPGGLGV